MKDADIETRRAVAAQAALFHGMCESVPSLSDLQKQSTALGVAAAAAEKAFTVVFAINPQVGIWCRVDLLPALHCVLHLWICSSLCDVCLQY